MGNDFILEFQYSFKNEWKIFRKSIIFHLAMISCFVYFVVTQEEVSLFIGLIFTVISIPQLILHLQYRLKDRNKKIIVNYSKSTIRIEERQKLKLEFNIADIKHVIRSKSQEEENNTYHVLPYCFYHYSKIILLNDKKVFFTDFISKNIALPDIEIKERIAIFNIIN